MLISLALIWGASFMFIKVADRQFSPATLIMGRLGLAAVTLALIVPFAVGTRATIAELRANAGWLVVVALVNTAIPFWLLSWGETKIDSGLASIIQGGVPIFNAAVAFVFFREVRVTGMRLAGIAIGFVGVALLVGAHLAGGLLPALAVVLAALSYSAAGLFAARRLRETEPLVIAAGSMVGAAIVMAPFGLATLPGSLPGWKETASVIVLGILGTGIAYILYFLMIREAGASRSILVTYLVPPVALAYGVLVLGEPLPVVAVVGLALILGGVSLAGRRPPAAKREA